MKLRKIPLLLSSIIIILALVTLYREPEIKTIATGTMLEQELSAVGADTLAIFDIDNVLLVHEDPWERGYKKERAAAQTIATLYKPGSLLEKTLDRPTRDRLWSIYAQARTEIPVDPAILQLIKKLQEQSVKVVALTRFLVGRIGLLPAVEEWRIAALKAHGINFAQVFPQYPAIIFDHCNYEGKFPVFKEGVLFTTLACSKGELLKAFFEKVGWQPRKVIMIDDKRENLESVAAELKIMGIDFKGFEYTGADMLPAYFDKELAEFQMRYLIEREQWLTGAEAQERLEKEL